LREKLKDNIYHEITSEWWNNSKSTKKKESEQYDEIRICLWNFSNKIIKYQIFNHQSSHYNMCIS
jgi:hypothetical protein